MNVDSYEIVRSLILFKAPRGDCTDLDDSESESALFPNVFDRNGVL